MRRLLGECSMLRALKELESKALQHRFNVDGEGGEYETLVIGGASSFRTTGSQRSSRLGWRPRDVRVR